MMKCLYLVSAVFHVAAGCALSGDKNTVHINGHIGDSVLLPCSCSHLNTKPQTLTWWTYRTGSVTEVLNDEHYSGRLKVFNKTSPANLSLLISDLRVEDDADYSCSTEEDHRDIRLHVTGTNQNTKIPTSPPALSSTPLGQVSSILVVLLLVISGVLVIICWRCRGRRSGEDVITEERPDSDRKQKDQ
ncbi:junctional adhesion molecule-like isoform X1, partial [Clarias magur]